MMIAFFVSIGQLVPFDVPHAHTTSITTGTINAKPVEQRAPINEMNAFRQGTTSAKESKKMIEQKFKSVFLMTEMLTDATNKR